MNLDLYSDLSNAPTESLWQRKMFSIAADLGFEQVLFAVLKNKTKPLEEAYIRSNYSKAWRTTYDNQKLGYIDPTVRYAMLHSKPLFWTPNTFIQQREKDLYEEAQSHGLKAGVVFPIHGVNGEFGMITFASARLASKRTQDEILEVLPELSLFRDYVYETSIPYTKNYRAENEVHLTPREFEVIKWVKEGKSSWEIGKILGCSEATVNFHINNLRLKFNVHNRQQAVIKAIQLGILDF
jgi:LuxR family quorum-sensing transcriptional regulator LasR